MAVNFLDEDFLLSTEFARRLYHEYAEGLPIFDYHCHLPVAEVADNRQFENLSRIWLAGDHYKWRAMRAFGVEERLITGDAPDWEKFAAWAETVPFTVRNPLYHWTHMELKDPFGINGKLLSPDTAREIYDHCNALLQRREFRARGLMEHFKVKVVCTTDDPTDDLEHHRRLAEELSGGSFGIRVLPAFRPDKAMGVERIKDFIAWVIKLEKSTDMLIGDYRSFLEALRKRHRAFHELGCRLSDHGIEQPYAADYTEKEIAGIFKKARAGGSLSGEEVLKFKSAALFELAGMDGEAGWTQQFHFGALRNNSSRMYAAIGPDSGFDAMGDFEIARPLVRLFDRLDSTGKLARTIVYTLNPRDNELAASILGSFQDGSVAGKMQLGSAWWYNDQIDGMRRQMEALSNVGLISQFVGMLTDSRSFLSYPRHEYFRRLVCDIFGQDVESGLLPADMPHLGGIVRDICWNNAVRYFGIPLE
ncbi:MAG: glucuronate isomerase [Spirochaetaceae bacterium]|nr:MAG: glucuronate isomerase [Spirochaetaceae bacterium]